MFEVLPWRPYPCADTWNTRTSELPRELNVHAAPLGFACAPEVSFPPIPAKYMDLGIHGTWTWRRKGNHTHDRHTSRHSNRRACVCVCVCTAPTERPRLRLGTLQTSTGASEWVNHTRFRVPTRARAHTSVVHTTLRPYQRVQLFHVCVCVCVCVFVCHLCTPSITSSCLFLVPPMKHGDLQRPHPQIPERSAQVARGAHA